MALRVFPILLLICVAAGTLTAPAVATDGGPLQEVVEGKAAQARARIAAFARMPKQRGAPLLRDALNAGLSDTLTDAALAALGRQAGPIALSTLLEYTLHRRAAARAAAYHALADGFPSAVSRTWLERGLGDSQASVREVCAALLTVHGDRRSVRRLLAALDRGVLGAATAIGALADAQELSAFGTRLDQLPLPAMLAGYRAAFLRTDLPVEIKTDLLAQLEARGTQAVRAFLRRILTEGALDTQPRVRTAMIEALTHLPRGMVSR